MGEISEYPGKNPENPVFPRQAMVCMETVSGEPPGKTSKDPRFGAIIPVLRQA